MTDLERLIAPDIDTNLVRRVLADEFIHGHVEVAFHADNGYPAEQTFVVPVFNQEDFIRRCLDGIGENQSAPSDLVIIVDCCSDQTESAVLAFARQSASRFQRITVLRTTYPLFETRCDNLGFLLSRGEYVVEVQSDIEILSGHFDQLLKVPMIEDPHIFSTSGRAGHWFGRLLPKEERRRRFPIRNLMWRSLGFDRVGYSTNASLETHSRPVRAPGRYARAETVVRGPLCFRRRDLLALGLLDEGNFFLGYDEYDLHARGRARGLGCAYVPMQLNIPLAIGSTRQVRSGLNREAYERLRQRRSEGYLAGFMRQYRPATPCRWVR